MAEARAKINSTTIARQWAMTRWQSLRKLTIPAILLAILYHRPGNWAFEPTGRAHCSCSFREMSFHELTVELSAFDASLRMRGAIARGLSANRNVWSAASPQAKCEDVTSWSAQMYTAFVGVNHSWPGWNALRSSPH